MLCQSVCVFVLWAILFIDLLASNGLKIIVMSNKNEKQTFLLLVLCYHALLTASIDKLRPLDELVFRAVFSAVALSASISNLYLLITSKK